MNIEFTIHFRGCQISRIIKEQRELSQKLVRVKWTNQSVKAIN